MEKRLERIEKRLERIEGLLTEKATAAPQFTVTNARLRALNMAEAAEFTGFSRSRMYQLTSTGAVPHSKRGNRLFFDRDELELWLLQNKQA